MPPVMGVRKTSSYIQGMCKHIWLKIFLNKSMQECRDVRKSKVQYLRLITKKLSLFQIAKVTIVPMPPDKG